MPSLNVEEQVNIHAGKGRSITFPKYIPSLPYEDSSGDTGAPGYLNTYSGKCGDDDNDSTGTTTTASSKKNSIATFSETGSGSTPTTTGPTSEVIYYFKPSTDTTVSIGVCNMDSLSIFSGSLYILEDVDQGGKVVSNHCASVTGFSSSLVTGGAWASSSSSCTEMEVVMMGGVGYAIIVDGSSTTTTGGNNKSEAGRYILTVKSSSTDVIAGLAPPDALLMEQVPEFDPIGKAVKNTRITVDTDGGQDKGDGSSSSSSNNNNNNELWLIIGGIAAGVVLAIIIIGLMTYLMKSGRRRSGKGGGKRMVVDSDSEEGSSSDSLSRTSPPTDIFIAIK